MITSTDHDLYGLTYEQKVLFIDNLSRVVGKPKERTDTGSFYPWIVSLVFATDYQKGEAYRLTVEDESDVLWKRIRPGVGSYRRSSGAEAVAVQVPA